MWSRLTPHRDEDDAVCAARTIRGERATVSEDVDGRDVTRIDIGKNAIGSRLLGYAVDDVQRLALCHQRAHTADAHRHAAVAEPPDFEPRHAGLEKVRQRRRCRLSRGIAVDPGDGARHVAPGLAAVSHLYRVVRRRCRASSACRRLPTVACCQRGRDNDGDYDCCCARGRPACGSRHAPSLCSLSHPPLTG